MSEDPHGPAQSHGPQSSGDGLPPAFEYAGEFFVPLSVAAAGCLVLCITNALLANAVVSPTGGALALMQLLTTGMLGATAALAYHRRGIARGALTASERAQEREQKEGEGRGSSLFSGDTTEIALAGAREALAHYGRTIQPLLLAVVALITAVLSVVMLIGAVAGPRTTLLFALGTLNLAAAFGAVVGVRWFSTHSPQRLPEVGAVTGILRANHWFATIGAVAVFVHAIGLSGVDLWLARALELLILALALEQIARAVVCFMGRGRAWDEIKAPIGLIIVESLFTGANPFSSVLALLEDRFGVSVRSSYVLGLVRTLVPAVLAGMLLVLWLTTCLVVVHPEEIGVLTRFGRVPEACILEPGLRVKAPWPIDRAHRVPARRVQSMIIGRESDEELPFILWSKTHAENEYKLVLGQGRELVSLDVVVNYRIKDPVAYLFGVQNPEDALRGLAYRVIMQETVGGNLDEVLSEKRATFSKTLQAALQAELDAHHIGIEVVDMPLRGIHPPIEVADAYQGVVSAQVEMVTLVTQARAEREKLVPRAEADRIKAVSDAEAHAAVRLGEAKGEAAQFRAVKQAYALSPGLYRERRRLETLEQAVQDKQLYVIDDRYGVSSECWVDMRPQQTTP